MNPKVMAANTARPRCPNQVSPATAMIRRRANGIRQEARAGRKAITAEVPAATLMLIVRTKSTISAPIGMNAHASPNASPAAAAAPPPPGNRATR